MVSRLLTYLIFFESSDDDIFLHRGFLFISHKLLRASVKGIGLESVYVNDQILQALKTIELCCSYSTVLL